MPRTDRRPLAQSEQRRREPVRGARRTASERQPRDESRIVFGRHPVLEALQAGARVRQVMLATGLVRSGPIQELVEIAQRNDVNIANIPRAEMDAMTFGAAHQGVAAVLAPLSFVTLDELVDSPRRRGEPALLLGLDEVQDPQNAGALLRTAHVVGAHGAILPERRSSAFGAGIEKSSAGAVSYLPLCRVVNMARALQSLRDSGLWVVGLDADSDVRFDQIDWTRPTIIVVGNEGRGLRRLVRETCDDVVSIPMRGRIESLNAAVAGSLVLYEAWRGRGFGNPGN